MKKVRSLHAGSLNGGDAFELAGVVVMLIHTRHPVISATRQLAASPSLIPHHTFF
jgi:hypothetical protein